MLACLTGSEDIIDLLLKAGADPALEDSSGDRAFVWATKKGLPRSARNSFKPKKNCKANYTFATIVSISILSTKMNDQRIRLPLISRLGISVLKRLGGGRILSLGNPYARIKSLFLHHGRVDLGLGSAIGLWTEKTLDQTV
ncbi:hypothetical protein BC829DRAFT_94038 [Chytridium lagenaria]|nr:hypothetical protein BC829DRAFT_94038 [Chytridium lagenaria]